MSKFISELVLGEDSNPRLFTTLQEIANVSDDWKTAVNAVSHDLNFPDGAILKVLGFVQREGTFTPNVGEPRNFRYVAVYFENTVTGEKVDYSLKALRKVNIDYSNGKAQKVSKQQGSLSATEVESWIGKCVKVIRTSYLARTTDGREYWTDDISFVKIS